MLTTLILLSGLAWGQTDQAGAADQALATKIKSLLGRQGLGSDELAKREAAEKELIAIGPDVLPLLPASNAPIPAEDKIRLNRVRSALIKAEVEGATRTSLVTLSGEMLASEAIAQISKQTGNKLVDYRERFSQEGTDPKIKVSLDKAPFWEALDTVLDAAGLTVYNFDEERGALAYTSKGDGAPPRLGRGSYSGLFRLEPSRIEATRDLKNSQMHALRLTVDAVWEPRVQPIVLEVPLSSVKVTDEKGNSVGVDQTDETLEVPVESSNAGVEIEFPLSAPSRDVKQLASIKGKITAVVLGKVESFEFANLDKARAAELERGGVTVVVESCRKNGDIYEVNMRVRYDRAANALESHRAWIFDNECYLLDPQGNRIDNLNPDGTLLAVNEVGLSYKFDLERGTPASYKIVYKTPAAIIRIPVDFELKAVDLP
jgi:hypothetical protein